MSLDCTASSMLVEKSFQELDTENEVSSFTFSHHLNLYWEAYYAILENCDRVYTERDNHTVFDTYEYSRESILKLKALDEQNHYGEDFTKFIDEVIASPNNVFYLELY